MADDATNTNNRDARLGPQLDIRRLRGRLAEENIAWYTLCQRAGISERSFPIDTATSFSQASLRTRYRLAVTLIEMGIADGVVSGADALMRKTGGIPLHPAA